MKNTFMIFFALALATKSYGMQNKEETSKTEKKEKSSNNQSIKKPLSLDSQCFYLNEIVEPKNNQTISNLEVKTYKPIVCLKKPNPKKIIEPKNSQATISNQEVKNSNNTSEKSIVCLKKPNPKKTIEPKNNPTAINNPEIKAYHNTSFQPIGDLKSNPNGLSDI